MYTRYENLERMRLCNVIYDQLYRTRDLTSPRKRVQYGSISESSSELHVLFSFQVSDCFKLSRQPFLILVPRLPFFHAIWVQLLVVPDGFIYVLVLMSYKNGCEGWHYLCVVVVFVIYHNDTCLSYCLLFTNCSMHQDDKWRRRLTLYNMIDAVTFPLRNCA